MTKLNNLHKRRPAVPPTPACSELPASVGQARAARYSHTTGEWARVSACVSDGVQLVYLGSELRGRGGAVLASGGGTRTQGSESRERDPDRRDAETGPRGVAGVACMAAREGRISDLGRGPFEGRLVERLTEETLKQLQVQFHTHLRCPRPEIAHVEVMSERGNCIGGFSGAYSFMQFVGAGTPHPSSGMIAASSCRRDSACMALIGRRGPGCE